MSGKNSRLSPLESRKQFLIAESELNRTQMAGDMVALRSDVRTLTARAKSLGSIASSAAMLVAMVAAYKHGKAKPPWLQAVLKGAKLAGSIWLAFRARPR
jgi:uncharacterized BrkB/YihY/UPF0761 family membrane protein